MTKYARKGLRIAHRSQPPVEQAPFTGIEDPSPYESFPDQLSEVGKVANASSFARQTCENMYKYLLEQRDALSASLAVLENAKELAADLKSRLKIVDKAIHGLAKLDEPDEGSYSYASARDLPEESFNVPAKSVQPEPDRLAEFFS